MYVTASNLNVRSSLGVDSTKSAAAYHRVATTGAGTGFVRMLSGTEMVSLSGDDVVCCREDSEL